MTPEEKSELAYLIKLSDTFVGVDPCELNPISYGLNLSAARRLVELLRKRVAELEAKKGTD